MVTFRRPFTLAAIDGAQPAGTSRLSWEEQIPGLSFVAFRPVATLLHLPAEPLPHSASRDDLAAALAADSA
jgi:hypothetical protein